MGRSGRVIEGAGFGEGMVRREWRRGLCGTIELIKIDKEKWVLT
jgi:hypothetical protein